MTRHSSGPVRYLVQVADKFSGRLALPNGDVVDVELTLADNQLGVLSGGSRLGVWPIKYCRVSRMSATDFRLSIDGDVVMFSPDEPARFGMTAAQRFHASSLADRIGVVRDVPLEALPTDEAKGEETVARLRTGPLKAPFVIVTVVVAVAVLVLLAGLTIGNRPVAQEASPATIPPTSVVAPASEMFGYTPEDFRAEWNRTAEELGQPLLIPGRLGPGPTEHAFNDFLTLQTTVGADGTIDGLTISADPAGDDDGLALAAFGVALSVADPGLAGSERRAVLAELGLDVSNPSVAGLDGETVIDGVRYSLRYFPEFSALLFTLTPATR